VLAPLAVSVAEAPAHIVDTDAFILTLGATLTVIVFESVAVQPPAFVAVTEYVAVAEGLTVIDDDVDLLLHKYDEPPVAVSVVEAPAQIADELALILTLGAAFTVIVFGTITVQPLEFVPVHE
jgi:hypothetical protein